MAKELYTIEIWNPDKYTPTCLYRSDLYVSKEAAKKAFLDLDTKEMFTAIDGLLLEEEGSGLYWDKERENDTIDELVEAYAEGDVQMVEWVTSLKENVINGMKGRVFGLEMAIGEYTAHLPEDGVEISVIRGVASVTSCPDHVKVIITDFDSLEEAEEVVEEEVVDFCESLQQRNVQRVMYTSELLEHVQRMAEDHNNGLRDNASVDARLCLNCSLRSTHFLEYEDGTLYDEGCDGERREITLEQFQEEYPTATWLVDVEEN